MFSVRFQMALEGNLHQYEKTIAYANTSAIRTAVNRFKTQARRQVERAGLGKRLGNAIRSEIRAGNGADITKTGVDANPRGRVFSTKRKKDGLDLIEVFERGVTIQGTPYLAIPTPAAGGRRAKSPSDYPEGTFRFVPVKRGRGRTKKNAVVAVLVHKKRKEVWYSLLKTVTLKKRLRLDELYRRISGQLDAIFTRAYTRQFSRLRKAGARIKIG